MNKPKAHCIHCEKKIPVANAYSEFKVHRHDLPVDPGRICEPDKGITGGFWWGACRRCWKIKSPIRQRQQHEAVLSRLRDCFDRFPLGTSSGGVSDTPDGWWCHGCHGLIPENEPIDPADCRAGTCQGIARLDALGEFYRQRRAAKQKLAYEKRKAKLKDLARF